MHITNFYLLHWCRFYRGTTLYALFISALVCKVLRSQVAVSTVRLSCPYSISMYVAPRVMHLRAFISMHMYLQLLNVKQLHDERYTQHTHALH